MADQIVVQDCLESIDITTVLVKLDEVDCQ